MIDLLTLAIGVGLVISLAFSELFGIAAGGMVVPGYVGLHLNQPADVAWTIVAAIITFVAVRLLGSVIIVYGRRRTVLMILVGYIVGALFREYWSVSVQGVNAVDYSLIGFIIPGLIAIWMDRQGIVETIASLIVAGVAVRLVLILAVSSEVIG